MAQYTDKQLRDALDSVERQYSRKSIFPTIQELRQYKKDKEVMHVETESARTRAKRLPAVVVDHDMLEIAECTGNVYQWRSPENQVVFVGLALVRSGKKNYIFRNLSGSQLYTRPYKDNENFLKKLPLIRDASQTAPQAPQTKEEITLWED